ncbi:MAG TPA: PhzF family phenazine biosynthesis protein, partial [Gemmatimonadota bacterium]|nr:PhzF family phenazine biosynthesis protein [Gemmatimonadota bacterium]
RWFTPQAEVDLCGHATLASAHVVLGYMEPSRDAVRFRTRTSGILEVRRGEEGDLVMDFPALPPQPVEVPAELEAGLGITPREVLAASDYVAVLGSADEVRALEPDMRALARLDRRGVVVTARGGEECDFVSRFFGPAVGVPEDPVTGSAHCELAPLWAGRLGRTRMRARQLSRRGGEVRCAVRGDRVELAGRAVLYLEGTIRVPGDAGMDA